MRFAPRHGRFLITFAVGMAAGLACWALGVDLVFSLLIVGVAANFFFYIAVNLSMVMGMAPVVGVPLPLLSYGGSAMMVLLVGFGLVQSAHVHRPR